MFWLSILKTSNGSSWSRPSSSLSTLAALAECLTPFLSGMIDDWCTERSDRLGEFGVLYCVFVTNRVLCFAVNLRMVRVVI